MMTLRARFKIYSKKRKIIMIIDEIKKDNVQAMKDKNTLARAIYGVVMNKVLLAGGVSANRELRKTVVEKVGKCHKNVEVVIPPMWCCTDNAAMLAMAAYYSDEELSDLSMSVDPSLSL